MAQSIRIYDDLGNVESAFEDGLLLLNERQRKDAEGVAAVRRTARSLLAIQKGDFEGYTFRPNQVTEFDKTGGGW
jgi:hypothetical protein